MHTVLDDITISPRMREQACNDLGLSTQANYLPLPGGNQYLT
jgi:hypothetical protein